MFALTARIAGRRSRVGSAPITPKSTITLNAEASNPADSEAVAVYANGSLGGYLEAGLARLVRPLLLRARPVRATASEDGKSLTIWIPGRAERLGRNLVEVASSDGSRTYLVDRKRGVCTCPAGRYGWCKHRTQVRARRQAVASNTAAPLPALSLGTRGAAITASA